MLLCKFCCKWVRGAAVENLLWAGYHARIRQAFCAAGYEPGWVSSITLRMVTVAAIGAPRVGQHRRHVAVMTQSSCRELGVGAMSGSVASMENALEHRVSSASKARKTHIHTHTYTSVTQVWLDVLPTPWPLCRWVCGVGVLLPMEMLLELFSTSSGQG